MVDKTLKNLFDKKWAATKAHVGYSEMKKNTGLFGIFSAGSNYYYTQFLFNNGSVNPLLTLYPGSAGNTDYQANPEAANSNFLKIQMLQNINKTTANPAWWGFADFGIVNETYANTSTSLQTTISNGGAGVNTINAILVGPNPGVSDIALYIVTNGIVMQIINIVTNIDTSIAGYVPFVTLCQENDLYAWNLNYYNMSNGTLLPSLNGGSNAWNVIYTLPNFAIESSTNFVCFGNNISGTVNNPYQILQNVVNNALPVDPR